MTAKARSKVAPHPFAPDPGLPPDVNGRHVCARCRLIGEPDDAHHTLPVVPEQAEHRSWYEHEDGGDE